MRRNPSGVLVRRALTDADRQARAAFEASPEFAALAGRVDQVVAIIRDRLPHADIQFGGGRVDGFDRQGPIAVTAADRDLGYRPRWGLAPGIDDLCAWREAQEAC